MRLAYDLSVLRHPPAGTARYATELLAAMLALSSKDQIIVGRGWPRISRGGWLRKAINLGSDLGWLTAGAATLAARNHIDAWFSPANVLPFALSRPLVVTILDSNVVHARDRYDRAYATYAALMFRSAGRRASAVLTLSEDARRRIASDFDIPLARIVVAYPGIDHALRISAGARPEGLPSTYALFVGQTEPHKNLERLVAAWSAGVPEGMDLVIAGPPGRAETGLLQAIARSPARTRIHRLGRLAEDVLARLYEDATCFVFPSLVEGFGMPPLEAMARGVPTAVSRIGVLLEVTRGAALTFDPLDPAAIAAAVSQLVEGTAERRRLQTAGPMVAREYRWERTADTAWAVIRGTVRA